MGESVPESPTPTATRFPHSFYSVAFLTTACFPARSPRCTDVRALLSDKLLEIFEVPSGSLSVIIFASVVLALTFAAFALSMQLEEERQRARQLSLHQKARRLRWSKDDAEVKPSPLGSGNWHLFLSHVWSTGQDQVRIIKQRLLEMIPELQVFLDVDGEPAPCRPGNPTRRKHAHPIPPTTHSQYAVSPLCTATNLSAPATLDLAHRPSRH